MEATTYQEVQGLSRMTVGELRDKYLEVFGEETRSYHKEFLRKRIAWRIQALADGDLSERARRRAEELANDADLRTRSPRDPVASGSAEVKARTAISRIWDTLKTMAQSAWEWIKAPFEGLASVASSAWEQVKTAASSAFGSLASSVSSLANSAFESGRAFMTAARSVYRDLRERKIKNYETL